MMSDGDLAVGSGIGCRSLFGGEISSSDNDFPEVIVRPSDSC